VLDGAAIVLDHGHRVVADDDAVVDEPIGVDRPRRGALADLLVHHRLSHRGLVGLVVTEASVGDEIDDHILLELVAVVQRHAGDEDHRLRIIAVHVEHR